MAATLTPAAIARGSLDGSPIWLYKKTYAFVDGDPAAGLTDEDLGDISGALAGLRVAFGDTAPDTLTVTIKDKDGVTVVTGTVTASGEIYIDQPILFVNGLTMTLAGNTVAEAQATIVLYLLG